MSASMFVVIAILIEGLTGVVKSILAALGVKMQDWMDQAVSLALSLLLAFSAKVDLFVMIQEAIQIPLSAPPILGMFLAGLVLSRGSNAVHDIFKNLNPGEIPTSERFW